MNHYLGHYNKALEHYDSSLALSRDNGNSREEQNVLIKLAATHCSMRYGLKPFDINSHVARCSHKVTPCVNHDHPKGHFIINGQIVLQANFFRIMVSKRVFYLPELIIFLIRNHQVMHEIPPGDAERPLRHLWLRA